MDVGHIRTTRVRDCYDGGDQHRVDDEHQVGERYFLEDTQVRTTFFRIPRSRGLSSPLSSYDDPFYHPVDYAPTDRDVIGRAINHAIRSLSAHTLVLQMLFSRLQAAKHRKPGLMLLIQRLVLRSARAYRSLR